MELINNRVTAHHNATGIETKATNSTYPVIIQEAYKPRTAKAVLIFWFSEFISLATRSLASVSRREVPTCLTHLMARSYSASLHSAGAELTSEREILFFGMQNTGVRCSADTLTQYIGKNKTAL